MPVVSNDFSDIVYNRRSIRNFDPSVKIPREELLEILDKTVTAPSSVNMQPWRFVVVESAEGKALRKEWGIADTYAGVACCILGYADGPLPEAKPRKNDYIVRV